MDISTELQIFYNSIEVEYKIDKYSATFPNIEGVSKKDRIVVRYEHFALHNFGNELFKEWIAKEKNRIIEYFSQRVEAVINIHLLAKYYHLLLVASQNNKYAVKAIEYYQQILAYYLSTYDQDFHIVRFSEVLKLIISITARYKISDDILKRQINNYLRNGSLSPKIKTFIFENIRDSKLFKSPELNDFPQLCIDLSKVEVDFNIKERLLILAINFSRKTSNIALFKVTNELLGDLEYQNIKLYDDNNLAVPHLNERTYTKIINYYKHAGNKEKQAKAIRELEANKKHLKFIKIQSRVLLKNPKQFHKAMNEYLENFLNTHSTILIYKLCMSGGDLLFVPYKKVQESVKKQMEQTVYHHFFDSKLVDINNNVTSMSHETVNEHQFFHTWLKNRTMPFIIDLFAHAISKRKLSYSKVKKALTKTAFGIEFEAIRDETTIKYNWFSLIDIGIQEFFKQFSKALKQENTDWRFTIDFLAPKFEAILRDIISETGGEVTVVKDGGDTEWKPLEKLLSEPIVKEIFDEDDIFLFKHTFTRVGMNVRNDVAHGICKPIDYNLYKAILILLCIFRLNKITLYIAKETN